MSALKLQPAQCKPFEVKEILEPWCNKAAPNAIDGMALFGFIKKVADAVFKDCQYLENY